MTELLTFLEEALVQETQMAASIENLEISKKTPYAVRIGVFKSRKIETLYCTWSRQAFPPSLFGLGLAEDWFSFFLSFF